MDWKKGMERRDFLKGITAAGLGASAGVISSTEARTFDRRIPRGSPIPSVLQPHPRIDAHPNSEGFWNQVRKAFVLPKDFFHFNTGTTGSMPLFSMQNLAVYNSFKSMDPKDWEDEHE